MANRRPIVEQVTSRPFWMLLLVGAIASLIQSSVRNLPDAVNIALFLTGAVCLAVGGAGVGLNQGRSEAEWMAASAELTHTRMGYPFRRTLSGYQALSRTRFELSETHEALAALVTPTGRVEWPPVDKALALIASDLDGQLRPIDLAMEEWRELLPDDVSKLERPSSERATEIDNS